MVAATGLRVTQNHCQDPGSDEMLTMGGGGLVQDEATFTCSECLFAHNTADKGGGLMVMNRRALVDIHLSKFVSNSAVVGGAVSQDRAGSSSFTSCDFISNSVLSTGGAVYSTLSGQVILSFCDFWNSTCTGDLSFGGSLALDQGRVSITNSSIRDSSAGHGGGVYTSDTNMYLENTDLSECRAYLQGGAIEVTSSSNLDIRHTEILSSSAGQSGGGIFASSTCTVSTFDTKFENLTSEANGGALYLEYNSKLESEASIFRFNSAGQ